MKPALEALPIGTQPVAPLAFECLGFPELAFELVHNALHYRLADIQRHHRLLCQLLGIQLQSRRMCRDFLVHVRLSEGRLIQFIVAMAPITNNIHHHVLLEGLSELCSYATGVHHRLGIISVDVKDRGSNNLSHVGAVRGRPRLSRIGSEPNLVVDYNVYGSTGSVVLQVCKLQSLGNNSLTGKCCIPMEKNAHDPVAVDVLFKELLGTSLSHNYWIYCLQVRRIGRQREMYM
mmetsp:Transcript_27673/g.45003  ORF Transcript_27673/g.45003 Transcript_27673/m.45003 type:complete len:233 (-) Transcript_27673:1146-1844(-)